MNNLRALLLHSYSTLKVCTPVTVPKCVGNIITKRPNLHRLPEGRADRPKSSGPTQFRPLYDIPFMFDAREFLRKKLIGQNVHVTVDYIQPANNDFPEKTCCTVAIGKYQG